MWSRLTRRFSWNGFGIGWTACQGSRPAVGALAAAALMGLTAAPTQAQAPTTFGGGEAPSAAASDELIDIGVVALVNPDATLERAASVTDVALGQDIALEDKLITDQAGQIHLMLVDKSAFTVGPNSEVTVDRFIYDPDTQTGDMALSAARGVMRFVGGELSKQTPIEISTSIGVLGIRGGILLLQFAADGGFTAVFGFGSQLSFTSLAGDVSSLVVRPGFMIQVNGAGDLTGPVPAPPDVIDDILANLEGRGPGGDTGGTGETNPVPENVPEIIDALLEAGLTGIGQDQDGALVFAFDDTLVDIDELVTLTEGIASLTEEAAAEAFEFILNFAHASGGFLRVEFLEDFDELANVNLNIGDTESVTLNTPGLLRLDLLDDGTVTVDSPSLGPTGTICQSGGGDSRASVEIQIASDGTGTFLDEGGGC